MCTHIVLHAAQCTISSIFTAYAAHVSPILALHTCDERIANCRAYVFRFYCYSFPQCWHCRSSIQTHINSDFSYFETVFLSQNHMLRSVYQFKLPWHDIVRQFYEVRTEFIVIELTSNSDGSKCLVIWSVGIMFSDTYTLHILSLCWIIIKDTQSSEPKEDTFIHTSFKYLLSIFNYQFCDDIHCVVLIFFLWTKYAWLCFNTQSIGFCMRTSNRTPNLEGRKISGICIVLLGFDF